MDEVGLAEQRTQRGVDRHPALEPRRAQAAQRGAVEQQLDPGLAGEVLQRAVERAAEDVDRKGIALPGRWRGRFETRRC